MARPAALESDAKHALAPRLWGGLAATLLGVLGLGLLVARVVPLWLGSVPVVAFCAAVVLGFRRDGAPGNRNTALMDALTGAGALGAASAAQQLYAPAWPSLLLVALGAATALSIRSGPLAARLVALTAAVLELLRLLGPRHDLPSVIGMAAAVASVPLLVEQFARGQRERLEDWARDSVDQRLRAIDEDARAYRLIASTTRGDIPMEVRESRRKVGSVHSIRESVYALMELGARSLEPHTCALFMLDGSGKQLKVAELISRSDFVVTGGLPADKGVLGTVVKKKQPLALRSLRPDFAGITWYHPPVPPKAVLAVPVLEGEHLRGVLVCDWLEDRELSDRDASVVSAIAREVMRSSENERLFATLDREKNQLDSLYKASQDFLKAVTMEDTFKVTLTTARQVSDASVAVLCLQEGSSLRVVATDGIPGEHAGRPVVDDSGLLTSCLRNQTLLPAGSWEPEAMRKVLGPDVPLDGIESLRILPFREKTEAVGVLVVGAPRKHAFPFYVDDRLQMVADMASLSVASARLYQRLERMATTDGLTGLLNHRTFQEKFTEALRRAQRYKRPVSMILTDIDHFKNVNDTYGHPVGDEVIRRVAAVLSAQTRATDIVARYGGEEFAVVMEETDAQGCLMTAERIRQAVQKEVVQTEMGPLKVTLSLGVAAYPSHGEEKHVLIDRADQALYTAKHNGRNRAVIGTPATPEIAIPITPAEKA